MTEIDTVRRWRSTANMHEGRRHWGSDWAATRRIKASGSSSPAIRPYPSNQESTWFKRASLLEQAQHLLQPLLNGCKKVVVVIFSSVRLMLFTSRCRNVVAGRRPESLLVKVTAQTNWAGSYWSVRINFLVSRHLAQSWFFFFYYKKKCGLPSFKHSSLCP